MRPPRIALFRGRGIISALIRWQTDGRYSHAAILLPDGDIIESWQGKGVQRRRLTNFDGVDIYETPGLTDSQCQEIINFSHSQLGKRYDYWGVLRFISRRRLPDNDKWWCSEFVFATWFAAGFELLARTLAYEVSPMLLARSTRLVLRRTEDETLAAKDDAPPPAPSEPEKREVAPLSQEAGKEHHEDIKEQAAIDVPATVDDNVAGSTENIPRENR